MSTRWSENEWEIWAVDTSYGCLAGSYVYFATRSDAEAYAAEHPRVFAHGGPALRRLERPTPDEPIRMLVRIPIETFTYDDLLVHGRPEGAA